MRFDATRFSFILVSKLQREKRIHDQRLLNIPHFCASPMIKTPDRPDIPKGMARRIRTAQDKVLDQRDRIEHAEKRIREETAEMFFFDANPRAWVNLNYGPDMAIDAYPPVTRADRIKESLASRVERRPVRALEYRDAELNLAQVEKEVLAQVGEMRPSNGRVPWPKPLSPFRGYEAVLDTGEDAVMQAKARLEKETVQSKAWFANYRDDGAAPGEGSPEALAGRRCALRWPSAMEFGQLTLGNGAAFRVTAWSKESIAAMQRVIDVDQAGGVVGNLWDLACGIVLSGCDWMGFREWRDGLVASVHHILDEEARHEGGKSLNDLRLAENARYDAIRVVLADRYLPEDVVNIESFVRGTNAMPSRLFRFWKEQGFSEAIARNWFLKSQPHTRVFPSDQNDFGPETWKAMRCVGLILDGVDIPLDRAVGEFKLQPLMLAMETLGLKPSRIVTECRAALLSFPDPSQVRVALAHHGYLQLHSLDPPPDLGWEEFQSWRMQIRAMAGLLTDLLLDNVPQAERKVLLR